MTKKREQKISMWIQEQKTVEQRPAERRKGTYSLISSISFSKAAHCFDSSATFSMLERFEQTRQTKSSVAQTERCLGVVRNRKWKSKIENRNFSFWVCLHCVCDRVLSHLCQCSHFSVRVALSALVRLRLCSDIGALSWRTALVLFPSREASLRRLLPRESSCGTSTILPSVHAFRLPTWTDRSEHSKVIPLGKSRHSTLLWVGGLQESRRGEREVTCLFFFFLVVHSTPFRGFGLRSTSPYYITPRLAPKPKQITWSTILFPHPIRTAHANTNTKARPQNLVKARPSFSSTKRSASL